MATSRLCSVPDCGNLTQKGEPLRYFREVVLAYEGDDCLPWPYAKMTSGYGTVSICGKTTLVHRLSCERANGPPPTPKHEAAHSCGYKPCCNPRHLSWKTRAGNQADRLIHGTHNRGTKQGQSKLTEADIRRIRSLKGELLQREIGEQFGITQTAVGMIHRGERWGWLDQ